MKLNLKKYVPWNQVWSLLKAHLVLSILSGLLGLMVLISIIANPVGNAIFTGIMMVIYFFSIYGAASNCALRDLKPYTEEEPYPWKGLLLPVGIILATLALWGLYQAAWHFMTIDGNLATITGIACNVIFVVWTFMYNALMGLQNGGMNWYAYVVVLVVPVAASGLGYYAGYRGFDLYDKLMRFVYEKKK